MKFEQALKEMKNGAKVKLPSWAGFWCWDEEKQTIMMHCKGGKVLDIRETQNVDYTMSNVASEDWIFADSQNCPEMGGVATFGFSEAIKYIKRGLKVAREGWNGKDQYIVYIEPWNNRYYEVIEKADMPGTLYPYIAMKTSNNALVPWLASQTDMLNEDWVFVE